METHSIRWNTILSLSFMKHIIERSIAVKDLYYTWLQSPASHAEVVQLENLPHSFCILCHSQFSYFLHSNSSHNLVLTSSADQQLKKQPKVYDLLMFPYTTFCHQCIFTNDYLHQSKAMHPKPLFGNFGSIHYFES